MRRTTICRSERAALLALVAGLLGGGLAPALAAQDTTQAQPDTSTAAQDTSQAAPAPALLGQLPATHVVATGETLWSIAQLYYGDPLLWPEVYRLNTALNATSHSGGGKSPHSTSMRSSRRVGRCRWAAR